MNSINMTMATPSSSVKIDVNSDSLASIEALQASSSVTTLANIAIGEACVVRQLIAPEGMPEWLMQLEDIGFIAGEPVSLMARGAFGGDPLVIRIGLSTFALRKAEAACVVVDRIEAKVAA